MAGYLERFEREPANSRWPFVRKWLFDEPLPFFAELRTHRPILEMPELTLATRYDDCSLILREHDAFTVELYKPKQGDYWMAQDDTPVHWREKTIMQAVLDREQIPAIRTYVTDKAASLLKAAGGHIDAVDGLARAVPLALAQDWFGFVDSDPEELFELLEPALRFPGCGRSRCDRGKARSLTPSHGRLSEGAARKTRR